MNRSLCSFLDNVKRWRHCRLSSGVICWIQNWNRCWVINPMTGCFWATPWPWNACFTETSIRLDPISEILENKFDSTRMSWTKLTPKVPNPGVNCSAGHPLSHPPITIIWYPKLTMTALDLGVFISPNRSHSSDPGCKTRTSFRRSLLMLENFSLRWNSKISNDKSVWQYRKVFYRLQ